MSYKIDSTTLSKLAYQPGDTVIFQATVFGTGNNSKTQATIIIPTTKSLDYVSGATLTWGNYNITFYNIKTNTSVSAAPGTAAATVTTSGLSVVVTFPQISTDDNYARGMVSIYATCVFN